MSLATRVAPADVVNRLTLAVVTADLDPESKVDDHPKVTQGSKCWGGS